MAGLQAHPINIATENAGTSIRLSNISGISQKKVMMGTLIWTTGSSVDPEWATRTPSVVTIVVTAAKKQAPTVAHSKFLA